VDKNKALRLLNLSPSFTHEELKMQWRKLAKEYHPDLAGGSSTESFILLADAYHYLKSYRQKYPQEQDWEDLFRNDYTYCVETVYTNDYEKTFIQIIVFFILVAMCLMFLQTTNNQLIKSYHYYASLGITTLVSNVLAFNTKGVLRI
jgi:hypothetical protein